MIDVISNTSPLQYLHQLRRLELLPQLCRTVIVPTAVVAELDLGRQRGFDVPDLSKAAWATIKAPASPPVVSWVSEIGAGEAAVIALALEMPGFVAILDDDRARKVARARGIPIRGTLRLLVQAKKHELIERVAPLLDQLAAKGFRMGPATRDLILKMAGEA